MKLRISVKTIERKINFRRKDRGFEWVARPQTIRLRILRKINRAGSNRLPNKRRWDLRYLLLKLIAEKLFTELQW